ncbi:MAG TPA: cytochrome c oxidase subunit 3 [Gammaproteobacteria bacterium]
MNQAVDEFRELPVGSKGRRSSGWWGMVALVASEAAVFGYLLFSYYYLMAHSLHVWPLGGPPTLRLSAPGTLVLLAGSFVMYWGERGIKQGANGRLIAGLAISIVLAALFILLELWEWHDKGATPSTDVYSSSYFIITGFHLAHLAVGMVMLAVALVWACLGYFGPRRHSAVTIAGLYWHFVTVVWLAVFFTFFIVPRLSP